MWNYLQSKRRDYLYRKLVHPHTPWLLRLAAHRTGNPDVAEDLVQECCLSAWQNLEALQSSQNIRAWLTRILLNAIADHARTHARRQRLLPITDLEDAHWASIMSEDPGPYERLLETLSNAKIAHVLREIPDDFAIVVFMHDIEGHRYREIAEALSVPIGSVMSRLSRGRRMLGVLLRDSQNDDASGTKLSDCSGKDPA